MSLLLPLSGSTATPIDLVIICFEYSESQVGCHY